MPTVFLIDASPFIFRAYYSIPEHIKTPAGRPANAAYGFTDFLIQILKREPSHIALAFDGSLTTSFRNKIYPQYKATRETPPQELKDQVNFCKQIASAMGMKWFVDSEFEADDIVASIVGKLNDTTEIVMVSNDKDFTQLVTPRVLLWDFARDERYDENRVYEKFGVEPSQIVDYLALTGDSVDNIPGVKGIGPKSATVLLSHFGSIDAIYTRLEEIDNLPLRGAKSVKNKLLEHKEMAYLSRELATISSQAPVSFTLNDLKYDGAYPTEIDGLFKELGFSNIKSRINRWATPGIKMS